MTERLSAVGRFFRKATVCPVLLLLCLIIPAFPILSTAGTYYIDYANGSDSNNGTTRSSAWKRCPGMQGFSGNYTHSEGDVFIFKGGITWPASTLPLMISNSGTPGAADIYKGDENWYSGNSWTQPTFDGEGNTPAYRGLIEITQKSFINIENLHLYRVGKPGENSSARGIRIEYASDIEISKCKLEIFGNHAIVFAHSPSSQKQNLSIHDNDLSHSANFIEIGSLGEGAYPLANIYIFGNDFHDSNSNLIKGDHGDGIHLFCKSGAPRMENVVIHSNRWYGNLGGGDSTSTNTAQVYFEDAVDGGVIFNNQFSFENTTSKYDGYQYSPGFVVIYGSIGVQIYNNTFFSDPISGPGAAGALFGVTLSGGLSGICSNHAIKNNIFSKPRFGIRISDKCDAIESDRNLFVPRDEGYVASYNSSFKTLDAWKSLGFDKNSKIGSPKFINTSGSPCTLRPDSGSSAAGMGENLSRYFKEDRDGNKRSLAGDWDVGAYLTPDAIQPSGTLKVVQ